MINLEVTAAIPRIQLECPYTLANEEDPSIRLITRDGKNCHEVFVSIEELKSLSSKLTSFIDEVVKENRQ